MARKNENLNSNLEKIVNFNNNIMKIRVSPKGVFSSSSSSTASFYDMHGKLLLQNYGNFKKSGEPCRLMCCNEDGSWVDYPKEVVDLVKRSFVEGKPVVEVNIQGFNRLFDFYRMLEIDFDCGNAKSIAWIDVNGKCFFPQVFVNSSEKFVNIDGDDVGLVSECPKIEIEVKICDNVKDSADLDDQEVNSSKRKTENEVEEAEKGKSEGSTSNYKGKRRQIVGGTEMGVPRWPQTRVLKEEEKGYVIAKDFFLNGLRDVEPGAMITRIHQCTRAGPLEKARFDVFTKQMEVVKRARGELNLVYAWHGTSAKGVESILTHGFGMTNVMQGSQTYGVGVHLSHLRFSYNSATLSEMDSNGEKHVVLCRVILGKCENVEAGSQQMYPSSKDFDTGVDNLENPRWYVVWSGHMSTHILPEVVISYKPANDLQGRLSCTLPAKLVSPASLGSLFSGLRSSLPPLKVQELKTLYCSYKEGKIGKDILVKQLRSLVGDEMLRSAIRKIHG